jgi:hypothetical protein
LGVTAALIEPQSCRGAAGSRARHWWRSDAASNLVYRAIRSFSFDPETCHGVYAGLLEAARPGARLAYWNMLVPRRCPAELAGRVRALPEAAELLARDRAFFYSAFVLEEVL